MAEPSAKCPRRIAGRDGELAAAFALGEVLDDRARLREHPPVALDNGRFAQRMD
jgi:hypothetical protein